MQSVTFHPAKLLFFPLIDTDQCASARMLSKASQTYVVIRIFTGVVEIMTSIVVQWMSCRKQSKRVRGGFDLEELIDLEG